MATSGPTAIASRQLISQPRLGGLHHRFLICRNAEHGKWNDPAAIRIEGGSIGWQAGSDNRQLPKAHGLL
jgi:hypothetical protein